LLQPRDIPVVELLEDTVAFDDETQPLRQPDKCNYATGWNPVVKAFARTRQQRKVLRQNVGGSSHFRQLRGDAAKRKAIAVAALEMIPD
jgi:hypothetical protein